MLQVGFGIGDITPDKGMEMPGGFFRREGTGVRDKCLAVACVVHDGKNTVALVGIDTLFITRPSVEMARRLISKATKIPNEHILIGANHTHSGGPIASCLGCDEDPKYLDRVQKGIAEAVTQGWNKLHTAEIGVGTGTETGIAFNRRFLMRDGREITHPGKPGTKFHKDIVAPAGPIDSEVGVLTVKAAGTDKVIGVVVHFSCHSTVVGGSEFSPDYTAYLRKHLRAFYGENVPVVFLLGPCGDITQVDNLSTAKQGGPEYGDMMGQRLASEAIRVTTRMTFLKEAAVACLTDTIKLAIRSEPDVAAERPPFGLGSDLSKEQKIEEAYATERKLVAEERKKTPVLGCEIQALRIGPLGIVSNGAEYFCEYALRIKKASPFTPTWVVSLANEWIGYVPTAQAFVAGGYEPRTARSSKLASDAGQRIVEASAQALNKLSEKV